MRQLLQVQSGIPGKRAYHRYTEDSTACQSAVNTQQQAIVIQTDGYFSIMAALCLAVAIAIFAWWQCKPRPTTAQSSAEDSSPEVDSEHETFIFDVATGTVSVVNGEERWAT